MLLREIYLSYGYAFAGSGGGSHTGRIDYSNHTATMLEKGKGTYSGYGFAGTGNANYGYYAGGPGPKSSVSRLDYANDDTAATPDRKSTRLNSNSNS